MKYAALFALITASFVASGAAVAQAPAPMAPAATTTDVKYPDKQPKSEKQACEWEAKAKGMKGSTKTDFMKMCMSM